MLQELRIRGLGVISDAVLEFGSGLTVVTGETGAGKTMVVTGLALLLGGRADLSRLGPGVDTASVEGSLTVEATGRVAAIVADAGGELDLDEPAESATATATLTLRRVLSASGRSRAAAGGAAVPAALLARLAADLVLVHGQSDQFRLAQPAEQRATLDRYAGIDVTACRQAFARWQEAEQELSHRRSGARELAREAAELTTALAEIDAAAPQPDEDLDLAQLAERLQHADELSAAARSGHDALSGNGDEMESVSATVQSLLAGARHALDLVAGTDPALDELAARVAVLANEAADIAAEFADYDARLDSDPERLSQVFSRRAVLASLTRRYGPDIAAVLDWAVQARQRLSETDTSTEVLAELAARSDAARREYAEHARRLTSARRSASVGLADRVSAELSGLAMPAASLHVSVRNRPAVQSQPCLHISETVPGAGTGIGAGTGTVPDAGQQSPPLLVGAGPDGLDDVELALQPHPDAPTLAIQRGASGGELSRVMLAIEVVLAGSDPVPTMIFDEVDAGVGGRAALDIGRRLAALAATHQVIVVTHLAQVAAFADHHLVVDKKIICAAESDSAGMPEQHASITHSDIRSVTGDARVAELARMLSGADTAVARQHAAELVDSAQEFRVTQNSVS